MGRYLNLRLFPKPSGIPENWRYIICKSYLAQKYLPPSGGEGYVVVAPPSAFGYRPSIIHRTKMGYVDPGWFCELVPELEKISRDSNLGKPFSGEFNFALKSLYENSRGGLGMTEGQVRVINLFFEKYVPGFIQLCGVCFRISLPRKGAGERWCYRQNEGYEVRVSEAKLGARFACQRKVYVSHTELHAGDKRKFACWDQKTETLSFDPVMKQEKTHIPWEVYDYNKFSFEMPRCQCKKIL